jgi:hypothetical protein
VATLYFNLFSLFFQLNEHPFTTSEALLTWEMKYQHLKAKSEQVNNVIYLSFFERVSQESPFLLPPQLEKALIVSQEHVKQAQAQQVSY